MLADQYLGGQRGAGRKLLGEHGCGMGCICADMCCAAPPQCRQVGETCREERSMFSREVILTCSDGACNVTVDGVEACRNHLCLADTCSPTLARSSTHGCSFLNPHACSDCASCAYAGLGIWCADPVTDSGTCKAPGDSVCPRSLSHALSPRARAPPPPAALSVQRSCECGQECPPEFAAIGDSSGFCGTCGACAGSEVPAELPVPDCSFG